MSDRAGILANPYNLSDRSLEWTPMNQPNIPVVILCGGMGPRLAEQTEVRPNPLVEIGGRPILWHIMKHYSHYGFDEFVLALGYKGKQIKRYFFDFYALGRDFAASRPMGKFTRSTITTRNPGKCTGWT
jgi:glucose-1-phosphate cytidylyltransferase